MLRGNHPARIDEKGRLKIPVPFKEFLDEKYGSDEFCVTSLDGRFARIYPMEEWVAIEEKLSQSGSFNTTLGKFLDRMNYYGQVVKWDKQARILIPSILREKAEIKGDVFVMGKLTYLAVWNNERFQSNLESNPITPDEEKIINDLKI